LQQESVSKFIRQTTCNCLYSISSMIV